MTPVTFEPAADAHVSTFRRLTPGELEPALRSRPTLVLDVRRRDAFSGKPVAIAGAVPVILDDDTPKVPDVDRDIPIVVYCLCHGEESSSREQLKGFEDGPVCVYVAPPEG